MRLDTKIMNWLHNNPGSRIEITYAAFQPLEGPPLLEVRLITENNYTLAGANHNLDGSGVGPSLDKALETAREGLESKYADKEKKAKKAVARASTFERIEEPAWKD